MSKKSEQVSFLWSKLEEFEIRVSNLEGEKPKKNDEAKTKTFAMLKIGELEYRISRLEKSSSALNVLGGNVKNQVEKCVLAGASTPASGQGSGNPDQINLTSGGITRPSQCIKEIPVDMDFLENGCLSES